MASSPSQVEFMCLFWTTRTNNWHTRHTANNEEFVTDKATKANKVAPIVGSKFSVLWRRARMPKNGNSYQNKLDVLLASWSDLFLRRFASFIFVDSFQLARLKYF